MAITLDEAFIPIGEAPAHIPGTPHVSSVWRWVRKGIRGRKLEAVQCGGRTFTTKQAIQRFLAARDTCVAEDGTSSQRIREAERTLKMTGFAAKSDRSNSGPPLSADTVDLAEAPCERGGKPE